MPLDEMTVTPEAVLAQADQLDTAKDAAFGAASPEGEYTAKGLEPLANAINKVMPLFDAEPVELPTEAPEGILPMEYMRPLEMIRSAAMDAGMEDMVFDTESIVDDRSAVDVAARIEALAKSQPFKTFLKSRMPEAVEEEVVEEDVAADVGGAEVNPADLEGLFASRM